MKAFIEHMGRDSQQALNKLRPFAKTSCLLCFINAESCRLHEWKMEIGGNVALP